MQSALRLAIVRLNVGALGFLIFVSAAGAQLEKLHPANYGVWSPQVGSGVLYQLDSQGKTRILELSVVGTEQLLGAKAYWLETRMASLGGNDGIAYKQLVYESKRKLVTDHFVIAPFKGGAGLELSGFAMAFTKVTVTGMFTTADTPVDFRKRAKRIGTEVVPTWAGAFECEVWRIRKGGVTIWYSPLVRPFGLVKMTSKYGTVVLNWIMTNRKERILVKSNASPAALKADATVALRNVFPGTWLPVVGSGAAYELEQGGVRQDVEFTVVGSEQRGSELLHWLEVYVPCKGRGMAFYDATPGYYITIPNSGETRWIQGRSFTHYTIAAYNGRCTNKLLMMADGSITAEARALYSRWDVDQDGFFSVLELLQIKYGTDWRPVLRKRSDPPKTPDYSGSDFRKHFVLVGTETISTPAGTFSCEHWRSEEETTDLWLSTAVSPLGLVKKSGPTGSVQLVRLIAGAKVRLRENQGWKNPELYVELRPRTQP